MKNLLLILIAAAALFGAWYLGKTTGKDCCKSEKAIISEEEEEGGAEAGGLEKVPARVRILMHFRIDNPQEGYTYFYTYGNNEKEVYEIIADSFYVRINGTPELNRTNGKQDVIDSITIIAKKDKIVSKKTTLYTTYKRQRISDSYSYTQLIYFDGKAVVEEKEDKVYEYKDDGLAIIPGKIFNLMNPPVRPIGPPPAN